MQRAIAESLQQHSPLESHFLNVWLRSIVQDRPGGSVLVLSSEQLRTVLMPAFRLLRPANSYYSVTAPVLGHQDWGRAKLTWKRWCDVHRPSATPATLFSNSRAEQGVPYVLERRPEMVEFVPLSEALLEQRRPELIVFLVELPDNFNFSMLVDLQQRRLELISCVHRYVDFFQAKEWQDTVIWFTLFQFSVRLKTTITSVIRFNPGLEFCTLTSMFYLMLRLKFELPYESAALTCTAATLQCFIRQLLGTSTESIAVRSNLFWGEQASRSQSPTQTGSWPTRMRQREDGDDDDDADESRPLSATR